MRNDFERDPGVLLVKHKTAPTIPQKGSTGASARVVKTLFVCVKGLLLFPCRRFPPSGHVFVLHLRRRGVILGPGRPHRQPQKSSAELPLVALGAPRAPTHPPGHTRTKLPALRESNVCVQFFLSVTVWCIPDFGVYFGAFGVYTKVWCIPDFGVYLTLVYTTSCWLNGNFVSNLCTPSIDKGLYTRVAFAGGYTPKSGIHQSGLETTFFSCDMSQPVGTNSRSNILFCDTSARPQIAVVGDI